MVSLLLISFALESGAFFFLPCLPTERVLCSGLLSSSLLLLLPSLKVCQTCLLDSCLSGFPAGNKNPRKLSRRAMTTERYMSGGNGVSHMSVSGIEVSQETGSDVYTSFTCRMVDYCTWQLHFLFKIELQGAPLW